MKKVVSVLAMCSLLFVAVPPSARAQQKTQNQTPYFRIPPCTDCTAGNGLDSTYLAINRSLVYSYKTVTSTTVVSNIGVAKTNLELAFNHAESNGNNATANQQRAMVANIATMMKIPPAALVTQIQQSMQSYTGITPSRAAICQMLEEWSSQVAPVVTNYLNNGILSVENQIISTMDTLQAEALSGKFLYANYHPGGRLLPINLNEGPLDTVLKGIEFLVTVLAALAIFTVCAEVCGGIAAVVAVGAALVDWMSVLEPEAWGGQTQQDWLNQGTGCDPCD